MKNLFVPANILLPKDDARYPAWSVIACDQFTSDPDYWERVRKHAGDGPSTLHLICPECGLESVDLAQKGKEIGENMRAYLADGVFKRLPDAMILVCRSLEDGQIREGIVGRVDLEAYDYQKGAKPAVRATEETVASRLPARVQMRREAAMELPHLLLLADDREKSLIEKVSARKEELEKIYDFELMEEGGHISGYLLDDKAKETFLSELDDFSSAAAFETRYGRKNEPVMALAVGDGNHSLAAAKQYYEEKKQQYGAESKEAAACRFVLAELENLHSDALQFAPIHRVMFGVSPEELRKEMALFFAENGLKEDASISGQQFEMIIGQERVAITLENPPHLLAVGSLQAFLDDYLKKHPEAEIDYIHGEEETVLLSGGSDRVGFLLPVMKKEDLFPTVLAYGSLPRKTFSMGHAREKRYYLEAAMIVPEE